MMADALAMPNVTKMTPCHQRWVELLLRSIERSSYPKLDNDDYPINKRVRHFFLHVMPLLRILFQISVISMEIPLTNIVCDKPYACVRASRTLQIAVSPL